MSSHCQKSGIKCYFSYKSNSKLQKQTKTSPSTFRIASNHSEYFLNSSSEPQTNKVLSFGLRSFRQIDKINGNDFKKYNKGQLKVNKNLDDYHKNQLKVIGPGRYLLERSKSHSPFLEQVQNKKVRFNFKDKDENLKLTNQSQLIQSKIKQMKDQNLKLRKSISEKQLKYENKFWELKISVQNLQKQFRGQQLKMSKISAVVQEYFN